MPISPHERIHERSIPGLRGDVHPTTGLSRDPDHAAREGGFTIDARIAPQLAYDPLTDPHLQHLWRQPRQKRQMKESGFYTESGELMDPTIYRSHHNMVEQDMAHADRTVREKQQERDLRVKEQYHHAKRTEVKRLFMDQIAAQRERNAAMRKANAERSGLSKSTGRLPGSKKKQMMRSASSPNYQSASSLVAAARMLAGHSQHAELSPPASPTKSALATERKQAAPPTPQGKVAGVGVAGGQDFLAPPKAATEGTAPKPDAPKRTISKETKRKARDFLRNGPLEPFGSNSSLSRCDDAPAPASPSVLTKEKKSQARDILRSGPPTPAGGVGADAAERAPQPSLVSTLTKEKKREARDFLISGPPTPARDGGGAAELAPQPSHVSTLTKEKKREARDFLISGPPTPAGDGGGAGSGDASALD